MTLKELLGSLKYYKPVTGADAFEVAGVTCDSREVSEGFVFVAVKGANCDGNSFIDNAVKRGAKAVVVDSSCSMQAMPQTVSFIEVEDTRQAISTLSAEFYGRPSQKLKCVGITGTNGKTTVSYFIESLLNGEGKSPAVIGTVNYRFNKRIIDSGNTTPGPHKLQQMLKTMLDEGIDYCIMEVSSHALEQARVSAVRFSSAIFTNLTQDHLDYHKNMEAYFLAKAKLFKMLPPGACAIINADDPYAKRLMPLVKSRVITYSLKEQADISAVGIKFDLSGTEFELKSKNFQEKLVTPLIGRHNVYNLLAGIAFGLSEGSDLSSIKAAVAKFSSVPGRLESVDTGKGFFCFVDYAHSEDALFNVISALREISRKKIIVVFGCGGERDRGKRPKMGRVATELADLAIVTNDNPRSEPPEEIFTQIRNGINKDNYCIIADRQEAIAKAISLADKGDTVLIAGKGHENYQVLKSGKVHFDDREAVRRCLS